MRLTALLLATILALSYCEEKHVSLTPIYLEDPSATEASAPTVSEVEYVVIEQPVHNQYYQPSFGASTYNPYHAVEWGRPTHQPTYQPTYQPTHHTTYQPTYQPTYQHTYAAPQHEYVREVAPAPVAPVQKWNNYGDAVVEHPYAIIKDSSGDREWDETETTILNTRPEWNRQPTAPTTQYVPTQRSAPQTAARPATRAPVSTPTSTGKTFTSKEEAFANYETQKAELAKKNNAQKSSSTQGAASRSRRH